MAEYQKKVSVGAFAKKGEDYKDGDLLVVANEGKKIMGQFGEQDVFLVKLPKGDEKNMSFNQTSINGLIDAYGTNSTNWIGKQIKVHLINQNVSGKFMKVAYVSHPDAELTEDGFIMPSAEAKVAPVSSDPNPADIPF